MSENFQSVEEIAQCKPDDIHKIEGIDETTAKELISRAAESIEKEKIEVSKKLKDLGVEDALLNLDGMTQGMLVVLGEKSVICFCILKYLQVASRGSFGEFQQFQLSTL